MKYLHGMKRNSAASQLDEFMSRYSPEIVRLGKAAIRKMRALVPGAVELVYDNYNALVVAFGPSERASEAVFSIALYPRWVNLFFAQGAAIPDPKRALQGSGKTIRHLTLGSASDLDDPYVRKLIDAGLHGAPTPIDSSAKRRLVIRSISSKQRPRRPQV